MKGYEICDWDYKQSTFGHVTIDVSAGLVFLLLGLSGIKTAQGGSSNAVGHFAIVVQFFQKEVTEFNQNRAIHKSWVAASMFTSSTV